MTQFYIVEITKDVNSGEFAHTVHWVFDADANTARLKAESKYHEILSVAAVSEYAQHSATLLTSDGRAIMNQCYRHEVEPTPDPEPTPEEPEVTPEEPEVTPEEPEVTPEEETPVEETTEESDN